MKEKIFQAIKSSIIDPKTGKTSISDKTINSYVDVIAAGITEESQIATVIVPHVNVLKEFQANINSVAATAVTERETVLKSEHEAEIVSLRGTHPVNNAPDVKALVEEAIKPLKEKLSGYELNEKRTQRQQLIASKAKELGIPEWRQKEGFNISDETDEAGIATYLTSIKQNIVTAGLEGKNEGAFSLATTEDQQKEQAKSWASSLPDA